MEERIIELTSELVAIPTHESEARAQELLASRLEACGFDCQLQPVVPGRPNLVASRGGAGGTFINSHVDVHPPHGHPDPFTLRRRGDALVGRGALDAKGQIAALVAAVELEAEASACVVITCDEEAGGLGSDRVSFPDGPWRIDGGIVLEPTDFAVCTAQSGNIDVRIEVSGTAGHAYAPERSGSPIKAALAAIEELDTCRFLKAEHPLVGRPRANVGRVVGGEHPWRAPAHAELEMTLGVVPGSDLGAATDEVRTRLDDLARRWSARGTSFVYDITDTSEPIEIPWSSVPIAERIASALGRPPTPAGMPSWTDAGNFLLRHRLPCVIFGAGELAVAHSNDEWVRIADLVRLAEVLRAVLRTS